MDGEAAKKGGRWRVGWKAKRMGGGGRSGRGPNGKMCMRQAGLAVIWDRRAWLPGLLGTKKGRWPAPSFINARLSPCTGPPQGPELQRPVETRPWPPPLCVLGEQSLHAPHDGSAKADAWSNAHGQHPKGSTCERLQLASANHSPTPPSSGARAEAATKHAGPLKTAQRPATVIVRSVVFLS